MPTQATFEKFRFDLNTLELSRKATRILLRPKTALLLKILINNKHTVISKSQLILAVWGTEHVTDQSLFQAISELRQKLSPLTPIKTFPNQGYQWNIKTHLIQRQVNPFAYLVAASLLGVSLLLWTNKHTHQSKESFQSIPAPAALTAFSTGVQLLQQGKIETAKEMLQLSVQENPMLNEAHILLAQISLQQGDALAARSRALLLVKDNSRSIDAYTIVSAMDIISRSETELGQNNAALMWASQAFDTAQSEGFVCTAFDLQDRLHTLLDEHFASPSDPIPTLAEFSPSVGQPVQEQSESNRHLISTDLGSSEKPQHCAQMIPDIEETSRIMYQGHVHDVMLASSDPRVRHKPLI